MIAGDCDKPLSGNLVNMWLRVPPEVRRNVCDRIDRDNNMHGAHLSPRLTDSSTLGLRLVLALDFLYLKCAFVRRLRRLFATLMSGLCSLFLQACAVLRFR